MPEESTAREIEPLDLELPDAPEGKYGRGKKYAVKTWKPNHSRIIMLHVAGYTNNSISAQVGVNPEHVSKIINDPRGQRAIRELEERMFKSFDRDLRRKLRVLGGIALDNIAQTVMADLSEVSVGSKAKRHQDDTSFKVLDRLGYTKKSAESASEQSGSQIPEEVGRRLAEAIEKAEVAKHAEDIEMVESEDGSFRAVSDNGDGEVD